MSFRFAVIGGGWYGCHIAASFRSLGFEVTVFEREERLFSRASGNNQFRLHQGFHYARSYRTRVQSRDGYMRFIERYPTLSEKVETNLYAVPNQDSLIDFLTYRLIMTSSGIEFREVEPAKYNLSNCSGVLLTDERVLLTSKARDVFSRRLEGALRLGEEVTSIVEHSDSIAVNGEIFDYVVDATWGGFSSIDIPVFYEPTLLLYYKSPNLGSYALTMVDGPLCSIYPTDEVDVFTLSSVTHTPLANFATMQESRAFLNQLSHDTIHQKRRLMEAEISKYYPGFVDDFEYIEPQLSIKTKIIGATDDRSCYVSKFGRRFVVMSGKIDTIFYASETILSMIEAENEIQVARL
ncbi:MAG: hypothetical protein B7Y40_06930 [Gammaproteobacteria bacterium 28-57-27]|nr:MAG: hypothetical protein B7Y40_06930 [Gammaproteobacteria bacterium 28-57-27]